MATDAQGRQLSEDGYYYWDGTAWQPVQGEGGASAGQAQEGQSGQVSPEIEALLKKMAADEELTDEEYDQLAKADIGG